ncbi:bifunctional ADP-dependent (S)-NAD(P)H-hydrate dehydratase/NAD(P)H-hydrate epimerase [Croceicoccus estronivorus]|nr:bifunctional ADP-dependent (S)-NAD(P)H-hydrate dehydratase/NAD(P)H-hydrate epimerase [Croceicoccus estronivorus]
MRAAEEALITGGETVDSLMQIAGRGAAEYVWRLAGHRKVTVLCGPGNNGGDGYVIAECLRARGAPVAVVAPYDPATDAARNARAAYCGDILDGAARPHGDVLVDCLFGSGLSRPLDSVAFRCLTELARSHTQRIAIDMPSGIDSDAGIALNSWLPTYDLTIALGAWKYAHWLIPSQEWMGDRRLVPIGIGAAEGAAALIDKPRLSAPAIDAHKYSRGLAVVVAGEMPGATLLSCAAAMKGGAGYVKLASNDPPVSRPAELVVDMSPVDVALEDSRICSVLIGPGMGRSPAMRERLKAVLTGYCPLVLDADALILFDPDLLDSQNRAIVATPHEGELKKLAAAYGIEGGSRLHIAKVLARASGMVIVAKGPDTIIAAPDGRVAIAQGATSWLSVAGTGDVLAGLVVSRLSTDAEPFAAACEAVWLHGEAARLSGPVFTAAELVTRISTAYAACL